MKMLLTTDEGGYVTLAYDCELGAVARVTRVFSCPVDGGYVIERQPNGEWGQVCDRLSSRGSTLRCASRDALPAKIRSEYRAMVRAAQRAARRRWL